MLARLESFIFRYGSNVYRGNILEKYLSLDGILSVVVLMIGAVLVVTGLAITVASGEMLTQVYLLISQVPGFPLTCEFLGVDLPEVLGNAVSGSLFAFTGIIDLIGGWGLGTKRKWAPWLMIIVFAVAAFFVAYNIVSYGISAVLGIIPWSIPALIVNVFFVIYYLVRRIK